MGVFGAVNVGDQACWWDYGMLRLYRTNNNLLTSVRFYTWASVGDFDWSAVLHLLVMLWRLQLWRSDVVKSHAKVWRRCLLTFCQILLRLAVVVHEHVSQASAMDNASRFWQHP